MKKIEMTLWVAGLLWVSLFAVPAEFWIEPHSVYVPGAVAGSDFQVIYNGDIYREFNGSYSVTLRDAETLATPTGGEMASGVRPYSPDAANSRPNPITMSWWAHQIDVSALVPGYYVMTTCWTVHAPFYGLVPDKVTCLDSNVFLLSE